LRTAKPCGPDAPTLASSRWKGDVGPSGPTRRADDGGKQARSPGRARRKPLKPLRGECRANRRDRGDLLVCFFIFAREAAGATGARHSLRPLHRG
jgi:hypothetical protein